MIRDNIKKFCINFGLNVTRNIKYNGEVKQIINQIINPTDKCVDIGCFKGEMLSFLVEKAPEIEHIAFEPLDDYFYYCKKNFPNVKIYNIALGNTKTKSVFQHVYNKPSYSGLKERNYDSFTPRINMLDIEIDKLDNIISSDTNIKLIKISANGGEHNILKGAKNLLECQRPFIIFEYGIGASDFYGSNPVDLFNYLQSMNYKIAKLSDWIKGNGNVFNLSSFTTYYNNNAEYMFFAYQ